MREPERCAYCGNIITGSRNKRIKLHFCSRACSGMYHKLHPVNTRPGSGPETQWTPVQIVITAAIPVYPELRPQVGRRYNAERYAGRLNAISYIVEIGGKRIYEAKPTAIGIVAATATGETVTGYYNASAQDKAIFAHHIQSDIVLDIIKANAVEIKVMMEGVDDGTD